MNKALIEKKIKNKEYEECITLIRQELIEELVEKIKQKDKYFSYSTTRDLYNKAKITLDRNDSKIAYELYNFDIMDEKAEYVLVELLELIKQKM